MRDILTSPRTEEIKHHRRVRNLRLTIVIIILFSLLIGALSYFSFNSRISIDSVVVTGNHIISTDDIESHVRAKLTGKYVYLFSRDNSLIYSKKGIYNDLMVSFPRINTLSVYRDNWKTLHIDLSERAGSYLYCGPKIPEVLNDIGENCYFINDDGYIFDKAPYFSGNVYFKYYIKLVDSNNQPIENPLKQNIFDLNRFHSMVRFIDGITALGFKPIYLSVDDDGIYTIYLDHDSENTSPTVIFKGDNDLEIILSNLTTAMNQSEFANEINSKYAKLLYIDLRFKNKVLYKFQ